ncbi:MAG: OprO/OprP family phosphate-selective porin [Schleiferiaceae bacterium]|nr:OprO/OprP family phosphate-selective porin [Schleiferiaceae bacterium]
MTPMLKRISFFIFTIVALADMLVAQGIDSTDVKEYNSAMTQIPDAFSEVPHFTFGSGIGIASPDSMYALNLRFRIQNRMGLTFHNNTLQEVEARVRRLRLRFDGFVYDPRITYILQLSFTRGDMDWENTGFPNVVRDAMIFYRIHPKLQLGFGQTKLPGNRQRVNSSGDLQFVDRSIVNATFNIDRDFGVQAAYTENWAGNFFTVLRGAVSTGEGRNISVTSNGLAVTGRLEVLPFGLFDRFGDYFEGDLLREKKPKLSAGFTFSNNSQTTRTGGQIGQLLFEPRDIITYSSDWLLKYRGFAFASEFFYRNSNNPVTEQNGQFRYVIAGFGQNYQASYIWPSNYEVALRYSSIQPDASIQNFESKTQQFTVGASKYLRGHRLKIQTDITYETWKNPSIAPQPNNWQWRVQVELGI